MQPLTREWISKAAGDFATARREVQARWESLRPHLQALTTFAVGVRYPGESADKGMAREALALCRDMRRRIRLSLGLVP